MASVAVFIAFALGLAVGSLVQRWLEYKRRRIECEKRHEQGTRMLRDIFGDEWDAPAVMDEQFVQLPSNVVRGRFER